VNSTSWQDRPVLVTGATGLLGGWLTRQLLDRGARVVALLRNPTPSRPLLSQETLSRLDVVVGDVRDQELLSRTMGEFGIDTVFHTAAQAIVATANRDPVSAFDTNIRGTWTVLEAARQCSTIRAIIMTSSDKAYGEHAELPYVEEAPLQGSHPYDVSKSCADLIAKAYATTYGLPIAITRCGNFFGGGDLNWNRIVPGTIRSAINGERPVIRSDGTMVRDYLYIEDGASAHVLLAEALLERADLRGEAFNFSYEVQLNVLDFVRKVLERMGVAIEPEVRNEPTHEIQRQWLSAEKARRVLRWAPTLALDQALDRTIEWHRQFLAEN
jgi:CDP-glucose 4,6-dehydratase